MTGAFASAKAGPSAQREILLPFGAQRRVAVCPYRRSEQRERNVSLASRTARIAAGSSAQEMAGNRLVPRQILLHEIRTGSISLN
jgi:hypothetical protein